MIAAVLAAMVALQSSNGTLTAIRGVRVGHHTLDERPTGCTVILVDGGAVAGVAQRGAAPGTRETDLLRGSTKSEVRSAKSDASVDRGDRIDAVVLSGGSAYGLDAATGVMRWLDEHRGGRTASLALRSSRRRYSSICGSAASRGSGRAAIADTARRRRPLMRLYEKAR